MLVDTEGTKCLVVTNTGASDHAVVYTVFGAIIVEADKRTHDHIAEYGGTFVDSNHEGPFNSARILTNSAARYGTFSEKDASREGDTANADRLIISDGHPLDLSCTPRTGEASFEC